MNKWRSLWVFLCLYFVSIVVGCSSKPVEQEASAQKALELAKEQHAEELASTEWKEAEKAWKEAEAALAKGSYSSAGGLYQTAKSRFERAYNVAKSRRDAILRDIQGLQNSINAKYEEAKDRVARSKLSSKSKKEADGLIREIDQAIEKLKKEVDEGNLTQAKATAEATLRQVYEAEGKIRGMI